MWVSSGKQQKAGTAQGGSAERQQDIMEAEVCVCVWGGGGGSGVTQHVRIQGRGGWC